MTPPLGTSATELAHRAAAWLATQPGDYDPSTGKGPDWGKAAPIGLLIILLLGAALFFLIKSMNKNLRRVPASFDPPSDGPGDGPGDSAATDGTDGPGTATDVADPTAPGATTTDGRRPPR